MIAPCPNVQKGQTMTRLIDADELEKEINKWMSKVQNIWMDSEIPPIENLIVSIMMTIQAQPTVEAIPIEWIKNWCVKNYPTYPRIITEQLLKKTETWRMIEDWEKENEID